MADAPPTSRPHLSIGEVLSLLQQEFPDITISKIRFLESQGLLDPERTPSGYRKFYEPDIVRLRWILSQQRDHFLPLKVIKDRLAEEARAAAARPAPDVEEAPARPAGARTRKKAEPA
ncbi:MAG: MerR family transcriptional regulator, partial [Acidimicrobiia bacterium]|nr:MerR family transcriptional regulator [Acidimicrobiia bacterium]